jgi:hypothetical protein
MGITMQAFQLQPDSQLALANNLGAGRAAIFGRLIAFVATALRLGRCSGAVPHYEGHAWCDSLEGHVNGDIAMCRRARL